MDFEFGHDGQESPDVRCLVAHELISDHRLSLWRDELSEHPPFDVGGSTLFLAYYAVAEMSCFAALGWPFPANVVDLYTEFRGLRNGLATGGERFGLPDALSHFRASSAAAADKASCRELAMRGGEYSAIERASLLEYCGRDVTDLSKLWSAMIAGVDLPRALLRGAFAKDIAMIEMSGVPLDALLLERFSERRDEVRRMAIRELDTLGAYSTGEFDLNCVAEHVRTHYPDWPLTATGRVRCDDDTLKLYADRDSALRDLRMLRRTLAQLRTSRLAVANDGRSRAMLSIFGTKTGRNAPRGGAFIFAHPKWMRGFIRPAEGCGVAYVDWAAQELGIAAALSGDPHLLTVYSAEDPYLCFAHMAGAVPQHATRESHPRERVIYKAVALAVLYGMGAPSLAKKTGLTLADARNLLWKHRALFPVFWAWAARTENAALLQGRLRTAFGWPIHLAPGCEVEEPGGDGRAHRATTLRTLRNFPMQGNGAEMMRLACAFAHRSGVRICAPVHDGFLIEAPLDELIAAIAAMRSAMDSASRLVLDGYTLKTAIEAVARYPERFPVADECAALWTRISSFLEAA